MGVIINIDQALKQRTDYNILREPLNALLTEQQEAWEKKNPIDLLFARRSIDRFQETYTSSIGFDHAFAETSDYAIGPIFNTAEGFAATFRTRTFQGSFIITQQVLEDRAYNRTKDDANAFIKRWHGDIVEYAMTAIGAGFGNKLYYQTGDGKSELQLLSADTTTGEIGENVIRNPLFTNKHTVVKREGMTAQDIQDAYQSNAFYADIELGGTDPGYIAKVADVINQVITVMENYRDDNNKIAGVQGEKTIVAPNDARLRSVITTALSLEMFNEFGQKLGVNPAYKRASLETSPYLQIAPCCANGKGFFIIDKSYNAANHGLEFTERIALTLDVTEQKRPKGIIYDGRQRFDINVASWRGIAYVYIGDLPTDAPDWATAANFTKITPAETIVKPVTVVGTVKTEQA